mmetsp:Transcript_45894/g.123758  ORF Transcript_45894/g.123758 Transcript_45894/m.123758 type:complete len:354 (+) Transcript_45894:249-1310(+)
MRHVRGACRIHHGHHQERRQRDSPHHPARLPRQHGEGRGGGPRRDAGGRALGRGVAGGLGPLPVRGPGRAGQGEHLGPRARDLEPGPRWGRRRSAGQERRPGQGQPLPVSLGGAAPLEGAAEGRDAPRPAQRVHPRGRLHANRLEGRRASASGLRPAPAEGADHRRGLRPEGERAPVQHDPGRRLPDQGLARRPKPRAAEFQHDTPHLQAEGPHQGVPARPPGGGLQGGRVPGRAVAPPLLDRAHARAEQAPHADSVPSGRERGAGTRFERRGVPAAAQTPRGGHQDWRPEQVPAVLHQQQRAAGREDAHPRGGPPQHGVPAAVRLPPAPLRRGPVPRGPRDAADAVVDADDV